jgi:class 3 adenylate cyclase
VGEESSYTGCPKNLMSELQKGTVTFLFTDIEGSTALTLGDGYPGLLLEHRRLLAEAVERSGGIVYGAHGDEVSAVFGTAAEAVAAASAGQRSFAAAVWPDGVSVRVRMGIHTGRAVGPEGEYLGLDVHRTARICAAGHGGQVLISEATYDALGGVVLAGLSFRDLGRHDLKGLPEPEHVFQLFIVGLRNDFPALRVSAETPPTPELPGRSRELAGSLRRSLRALRARRDERILAPDRVALSEPTISPPFHRLRENKPPFPS